jgi:hypothetical protein
MAVIVHLLPILVNWCDEAHHLLKRAAMRLPSANKPQGREEGPEVDVAVGRHNAFVAAGIREWLAREPDRKEVRRRVARNGTSVPMLLAVPRASFNVVKLLKEAPSKVWVHCANIVEGGRQFAVAHVPAREGKTHRLTSRRTQASCGTLCPRVLLRENNIFWVWHCLGPRPSLESSAGPVPHEWRLMPPRMCRERTTKYGIEDITTPFT